MQDILNTAHVVRLNLGNVQQTVAAGQNLNESTEIGQADHRTVVNLTSLNLLQNIADHLTGFVGSLTIHG